MSTLESDHNQFPEQSYRPPSQDLRRRSTAPSDGFATDSISPQGPLPPYAYGQHPVKRPVISTSFDQGPTSPATHAFTETPIREDDSPDPHEFYRRYQESFARSSREGLRQGEIVVARQNDNMPASRYHRRDTPSSPSVNGAKLPTLSSRTYTTHGSRYTSISSVEQSPLGASKSNPTLSHAGRDRQSSLKDLVNRFNQTPDEVPPLPKKSTSRSTSANSNPRSDMSSVRARTSSQPKSAKQVYVGSLAQMAAEKQTNASKLHQRRGRTAETISVAPKHHAVAPAPSSQYASQSMTDLSPHQILSSRKLLFGEVSGHHTNKYDLGHGIPLPGRRRGSEGSMRDPNPMFPDEWSRSPRDISPLSPSAWYLDAIPPLEELKTERIIPELPPRRHRRTRSDLTGVPTLPPTPLRMPIPDPSLSMNFSSPPASPTNIKRNSQSRIPVSTARLSLNSDSGNSTPSTHASSTVERRIGHVVPSRGSSTLPRATQSPRSPAKSSRSSPARYSPRRNHRIAGIQQPSTSPQLAAYISAPLPKKSPPLRSSRPRQPVSTATTSASRARATERFGGHENGNPKNPKHHHKHKRPPELGAVDFAARRQKIQQAFTNTVKENERLEERRRASIALEGASLQLSGSAPERGKGTVDEPEEFIEEEKDPQLSESQELEEVFKTPAEEMPKSERELTINTGELTEKSVLDMSQEDSPTLGGFNRFSNIDDDNDEASSTPSEPEPMSAVTTGTADSVGTFFDDEPQDHPPSFQQSRPTLSNHIDRIRDPSPSSPTSVRRPRTAESSDRDDRESIQIMLGETPIIEKAAFNELHEATSKGTSPSEQQGNRWSMSSWTSSSRSKERQSERQSLETDKDYRMERIEEQSPPQPRQDAHMSISTAASSHTPQPWSPAAYSSPLTTRSTMDSDAYSTINRVLDHYHDPSVVSPEMMNDVQQHIFTQSPDLARQGGWDPKKVTQLYLQELARNRFAHSNTTPDVSRTESRRQPAVQSPTSVPQQQTGVQHPPHGDKAEISGGLEVASKHTRGSSLEVDDGNTKLHRASLNHPDDWNMSPSIGDWIHLQAVDSPSDEKPTLPPKDWSAYKKELAETTTRAELPNASSSNEYRPQLPEIPGLGILDIGINITSPQDDDSPTILPPVPNHKPPPPPTATVEQKVSDQSAELKLSHSPSIYSNHSPSPVNPRNRPDSLPLNTSGELPQSAATSVSLNKNSNSSISQPQPSTDSIPIQPEATPKKSSPSPDQKRLTRRKHIIKELVDTEHSFGQDMRVVEDIYKGTSNVIIMSADDVKTLFSNSDQIISFSTDFLDALKQASKGVYVLPKSKRWRSNRTSNATSYSDNTDEQSSINGAELNDEEKDRHTFIGEAFTEHMGTMEKVYADYLKNHDAANQRLAALQKNDQVKIWLKECRAYAHDLTSAWDLDSLLVKPVQRILKYPLLLDQLLEVTPENHPDFTKLDIASREMKGISMRINEMKKRADLMDQMNSSRKRKESDVRLGLSKAFGRRTEKLRQQVGLADVVEDKDYSSVSNKFGSHFFQLQVVMRDVEMYTNDVQLWMTRFSDFIMAIELHIEVAQTSYPEVESKWRKFRMTTREMSLTALPDHINAIRKNVIDPMTTLLKLHEGPQKLMRKRNKRIMDYTRFKAIKDRGDKPDKKTIEQGEQFVAINETLKDELPKLFSLTGKLVEACLNSFVQLQLQWHSVWRKKLGQALDDYKAVGPVSEIVNAFTGDFAFFEAQVLALGICNGSMLTEVVNMANMLSPTTTLNGDNTSQKRPSLDVNRRRTMSVNSDMSPTLPHPDFGVRSGTGGFWANVSQPTSLSQMESNSRMRANSAIAGRSPKTPEVPGSYHSYSNNTTPVSTSFTRPATSTGPPLVAPRPSLEDHGSNRISDGSTPVTQPPSGTAHPQQPPQGRSTSPSARYSGLFSSAMPMSDSPRPRSPVDRYDQRVYNVLFLAASVYEFNIDRARKEAGYPYLTYQAGEVQIL
ncbi:MAG: hypothetical protein LQ351_005821 [Letrouitia transgressa]|nr:MAG: hypothetical protein LQ351_005821 [Letrouitia transgressa]